MTGCRCNYDGLKLIRFGALNGPCLAREIVRLAAIALARAYSTVSVVINGDNYIESVDYSDYLQRRPFLSRDIYKCVASKLSYFQAV